MLRRALVASLILLVTRVRAQDDDALDALRRPERLTVAINDQFLGQLVPDESVFYFVSNQDTRKEIFVQDREDGRAHRVFDEAADVTWPRVSPDGKHLLYISFSDLATGRLCVRSLPDGEDRRCLGDGSAALQAEWIDAKRLLLVARASIDGDLQVSEVKLGRKLTSRPLFDKNWVNPTLSSDGRWLVYVPLDRTATQVGPGFAARTAGRLEAVRLDMPGEPRKIPIALPGLTGQPAFAKDGRSLYFTQFFSDTNHDGMIDASDHGVLFRVPFTDEGPQSKRGDTALQLTDAGWNCQYPTPSKQLLLATCSRGRDLDVYELPLDGQVPTQWSRERLRTELSLGGRREEQLLLYRHALLRATEQQWKRLITMRLVMGHLELEEFAAAQYYAKMVAELQQEDTRGIGRPLLSLVNHRRARSDRERGRELESFNDDVRARILTLADQKKDSQAARVLNRVVRSELFDALGDKTTARRELESAKLNQELPRAVLELYYWRADALYRNFDDRDALVGLCHFLALRPDLAPEVQLDYARAATRNLVRGVPLDEALKKLAIERARVPENSELRFVYDMMTEVLSIAPGRPDPGARERMIALYEAQTRPDRKRAIVLDATQYAAQMGADWTLECLSERYIDDVPPGTQERRRAERLYKRTIMGRAFRQLSRGRVAEAREDFDAVYRKTNALESLVESISLRLGEGMPPGEIQAQLVNTDKPSPAMGQFIHAFLVARELPRLHGRDHEEALREARDYLKRAWPEIKAKAPARALLGALMHEQFLHENDFAAAESANAHYIVALELAQQDPRFQATLKGLLGLLHNRVGNYRIALDYIEQREKFPFGDDVNGLAIRLAGARARLHVGRDEESVTSGEAALAIVDRTPALASYRVLALDSAALTNLAAAKYERALALYDQEVPLLATDERDESRRNRFVVRLGRAAAALGAGHAERALADLDVVEPQLEDDELIAIMAPPHVSEKLAQRSYGSIAAGLRANANLVLGRLDAAGRALEQQRELFAARLKASKREEDARALSLVETRLAANASARNDPAAAAKWLQQALQNADALAARIDAPADTDQLHVLQFGAELESQRQVPTGIDLSARLDDGHKRMVALHDRRYRNYERWFEIYRALTMREVAPSAPQSDRVSAGAR